MPIPREPEVLATNEAFYRVFATRDVEAMDRLWAKSADVACIHPGWSVLLGRDRVMASWRAILDNPSAPRIRCVAPTAHVFGDTALVVCFEIVEGARLVATNIFVREENEWRMVHHQAGPVAASEEEATDERDSEPPDPGTLN